MPKKAPGKHFREGISLIELSQMFPDDATAEKWFEEMRWPDGKIICPFCDSKRVTERGNHPNNPYRCKDCRKFFSVKTGGIMLGSKIGYQKWAFGIYLMTTGIKGTSSMKLHRDLQISQKAAWHMAHRIREAWKVDVDKFTGTVEVDETFVGGKAKNMTQERRERLGVGRAATGKAIVVGAKERESGKVVAKVVKGRTYNHLVGFVDDTVKMGATVYTDDNKTYRTLEVGFTHEVVKHSAHEYARGDVHTQGIESFWANFKRGYRGVYHHMSPKHLQRYVSEFSGRHNDRPSDTKVQMNNIAKGMVGKRLRYVDLTEENEG